jgi:myo-inositol 2-dehydrogenase/D-chiro-inositol 1-dehydrogenase
MIEICQFGAGRIGKMHAANLARHPGFRLRYVVDVHAPSAQELARACGAEVSTPEQALGSERKQPPERGQARCPC